MEKIIKAVKTNHGSALLLAILVMVSVTAAGVGMATLLIQEVRQARAVNNALVAYYAAESGIEDGLFRLRRENRNVTELNYQTNLDNQASFSRQATEKEEKMIIGIEENQSEQFDIYNPQASASKKPVTSVIFTWDGEGSEWLEITWVGWRGTAGFASQTSKKILSHALSGSTVNLVVAGETYVSDLYRLRIKAVRGEAKNLEIQAFDEDGQLIEIPNLITLTAIGEFNQTQQTINIKQTLNSPIIGMFDYVLFSEKSIIK